MTLKVDVSCGQSLLVTNPFSRVSQECRVVYVGANGNEVRQVGFEFLGPAGNFWNISFPI